MTENSRSAERRRAPRKPTHIRGVAKTSQGGRHALAITDLSVNGCAIVATGHPLRPGSTYGLKINGIETLGSTAAWAVGQSAGLAFASPLHPAVADHIAMLHPPMTEEMEEA